MKKTRIENNKSNNKKPPVKKEESVSKKPKKAVKKVTKKESRDDVNKEASKEAAKELSDELLITTNKDEVEQSDNIVKAEADTSKKKNKNWPSSENELKDYIKSSAVVFLGLILILHSIFFFCLNSFNLINTLKLRVIRRNNAHLVVKKERDVKKMNEYIYYPDKEMTVDERFRALNLDKDVFVNEELFMLIESDPKELLSLKFVVSPDGLSFATIIKKANKEAIVLNGEVSDFYDSILFMMFSPDSKRFAYGVKKEGKELVVLDGKEGVSYDWIFPPRLFSPDSQYFIYKTRKSAGDFYVYNTTEGESYDQLYEPFYNEDDNSMIFFSREANTIYKSSLKL